MSRISAVVPKTYEELIFDAGVGFADFDYSSATDAQSLYALAKAAIPTDACLGATRGGFNWVSTPEFRQVELDDIFVRVKGDVQKGVTTVTVAATFTQFNPENMRRFVNASDITVDENGIKTLTERTYINPEIDYVDNLVIVARQGVNNYVVIDMHNCINNGAASLQTNNNGEAELAVTWTATISDPDAETQPYTIKWFPKAGA